MTDYSKIIFVNTDGDYEETSASDSLKFASYKTQNWELTDSLLSDVTNLMIKSDGSRAFAADQSMGGFKLTSLANGTSNSDAVNYGQLQAAVNGFDWKNSVRVATTAALPAVTYANGSSGVGATLTANANGALPSIDGVTLVLNDRLLVKNQAAGLQNGLYYVSAVGDGSNPFVLTRVLDADSAAEVTAGLSVAVEEGTANDNIIYQLTTNNPIVIGTTALSFISIPFNTFTAGNGIDITGYTISAKIGDGLKFSGSTIVVEPNDFAGSGLVDDGSDNLAIDWATSSSDMKAWKASDLSSTSGAGYIGILDSGSYFSSTTVEGALQELGASIGGDNPMYIAGAAINKGDVVYLSGNDTVVKMPITSEHRAIGLAMSTVSTSAMVEVQGFDKVVPGCLSGATAGTRYYWSGTALTTTLPAASGSYVWAAGVAKNATDLVAELMYIKKNS